MTKKHYYLIIVGLIILTSVLFFVINRFPVTLPQDNILQNPTETLSPTITPVQVNYVIPTLAPEVQNELLYPIKFEDITIEYKPRSGTFLIYYQGDQNIARDSVTRFFNEMNINQNSFQIEYRTLDPISLPPRVEVE